MQRKRRQLLLFYIFFNQPSNKKAFRTEFLTGAKNLRILFQSSDILSLSVFALLCLPSSATVSFLFHWHAPASGRCAVVLKAQKTWRKGEKGTLMGAGARPLPASVKLSIDFGQNFLFFHIFLCSFTFFCLIKDEKWRFRKQSIALTRGSGWQCDLIF